jgi:cob(I)alamin adenosyltransferase
MPQTRGAKQAGSAALDRLQASIEAAETALKDLQGEVSRNNRALLKDIGTTLKATRRNLNRSRRRIAKDLQQIQQALVKARRRLAQPQNARPQPQNAQRVHGA